MTAVNISGTFKKDSRPFNGIESIADMLLDHELSGSRYLVVAEIKPHASRWTAEDGEETPTVRFTQIEVVPEGDERHKTVRGILDALYSERTKSSREAPLFDQLPEGEQAEPVSERPKDVWLTEGTSA